jgi:phage gpG-like protein
MGKYINIQVKGLPGLKTQLKQMQELNRRFPKAVGVMAVEFYKQSFTRGGFIENGAVEKWKERKSKDKNKKRRAILVQSGRLKRSIRMIRYGYGFVVVGSDVPYAKIHNEGGTINTTARVKQFSRRKYSAVYSVRSRKRLKNKRTLSGYSTVRAHSRKINTRMPKRQFMGYSNFLNRRIQMNLNIEIKRILNNK